MNDNRRLLEFLRAHEVEFVLVGGVAAVVHGSSRLTLDIDVVYRRTTANLSRLVDALAPLHPYLRGAPPGLPFLWDIETLKRGLNFTLTTDIGAIDVLGEIAGGNYDSLLPHSPKKLAYGVECNVVSLKKLIEVKRAAGRPKDLEAISELEAILEEGGTP